MICNTLTCITIKRKNYERVYSKFSIVNSSVFLSLLMLPLLVTGLSAITVIHVGPNQQYEDIRTAIDSALVVNDSVVKIQIHTRTTDYDSPHNGFQIAMSDTSPDHLIIESFPFDEICTVTQIGYSRVFFVQGTDSADKRVSFNNLRLQALNGKAIQCSSRFDVFEVQNCEIIANTGVHTGEVDYSHMLSIKNCVFNMQETSGSGGQALTQPAFYDSINIENNTFIGSYDQSYFGLDDFKNALVRGNVFDGHGDNENPGMVSLHISNLPPVFEPNPGFIFEDNIMIDSVIHIVCITGLITDNVFKFDDCSFGYRHQFVLLRTGRPYWNGSPVGIFNNFFIGTCGHAAISLYHNYHESSIITAEISNNTFWQNGKALRITIDPVYTIDDPMISQFRNCVFYQCDVNPVSVLYNEYVLPEPITLTYSVCYPDVQSTTNLQIDSTTCVIADPLISYNGTANDYELFWSDQLRSPCINTGYPGENNELTDPDGTPPDIGCYYYPHYNQKYFERYNPSGIYWLSFPVLDDRTCTDDTYWNELGYLFRDNMDIPPNSVLNQIQWSYDGEDPIMQYISGEWHNSMNRSEQPKGYKVQFNPGMQIDPVIVNGFKADAANTSCSWVVAVSENGQTRPFENWIGYFVPYTQKAGDAFSGYLPGSDRFRFLDYIHTMKTRTWGTCRLYEEPYSPWIIDPNSYTLSEGDMVSLLLLPDAPEEMYWATLTTSPPIEKPPTTAFTYEEKLDYTPVFIEFDPVNMPNEVGLFVDGTCMGAAVVDSTLIDVRFYHEAAKDDGEIEVVLYYENKGKQAAQGCKVYNPSRMVFEDGSLRSDQIGNYAYLSFQRKDGESLVPLLTNLHPNYPNPFNPSTTVSFVLGRDMDARLDIYNVRGQRVNTLQNGLLAKGRHTFEWNGRDEQGSPVASGVYFSRLVTPDGSFVNKMMLMK